jgi:signal transduction histidine kinase
MMPRGWLGIARKALEPVETIIEKEVVREVVVPDFAKQEELNRKLTLAEDELKQKSNLLSTVTHELKTPLNAILGFSEIMQTERFGALGDERYVTYAVRGPAFSRSPAQWAFPCPRPS